MFAHLYIFQLIDENSARKADRKEADNEKLVFDVNKFVPQVYKLPDIDEGDKYTIKRKAVQVPEQAQVETSLKAPSVALDPPSLEAQDVPMQPVKPSSTSLDAPAGNSPPSPSIPSLNVLLPSSPPLAPPADSTLPLLSNIGEENPVDMEIETEPSSADDLQEKLQHLNTACKSLSFASTYTLISYLYALAPTSDADDVPPLQAQQRMYRFYLLFGAHQTTFYISSWHAVSHQENPLLDLDCTSSQLCSSLTSCFSEAFLVEFQGRFKQAEETCADGFARHIQ